MKTFFKKLIVLIPLLTYSHLYSQDCDIPQQYTGNTGSNMTVLFSSDAIASLPIYSASPYIVALSPDGLLVGSVSIASSDLVGGQQQIAIWGNDTSTPEVDGLQAGQGFTFQLIDGSSLYDLNSPAFTLGTDSYVTNGLNIVGAVTAVLNCSDSESNSQCDLPQPVDIFTGINMTVLFNSDAIASLPIYSALPYIVAITPDGMLVGSTSVASENLLAGQQSMPIWGDDTFTPEVDGAIQGEEITFQLVDGSSLYNLNSPTFLLGSNVYETNSVSIIENLSAELINCSDSSNPGCSDPTAFNYDAEADSDDGSCIPIITGCNLDWADNYDENANTYDGSCYREGCTLDWADNYDEYATIDDESCERLGCIYDWADNYDPLATISNSSCFIQLNEEEYQSLSESSQGSSDCEEIVIDIQEGWNIFGYTSSQVIEIGEVMAPYDDKIFIIKDNNGSQYWPANNYNGIGDFIPGGGYQIKAYEPFSISF